MNICMLDLFVTKMPTKVAHERVDPDAFDRLCVAMERIEFAAALRVAEILPISGFVASAGEARLLDEGFEQHWAVGVACVPIISQASADQSEDARSEISTSNPRQDQKAGIVDDEVQVAPTLLGGPADGVIARLGFPSARAEAEQGDDFSGGTHEVAQLRPRQRLMAEV